MHVSIMILIMTNNFIRTALYFDVCITSKALLCLLSINQSLAEHTFTFTYARRKRLAILTTHVTHKVVGATTHSAKLSHVDATLNI